MSPKSAQRFGVVASRESLNATGLQARHAGGKPPALFLIPPYSISGDQAGSEAKPWVWICC
uniref:hypothetical protein n=1 Tax=Rhizobium fredii TaxID=380 RepID=UPI001AEC4B21